MEKLGVIYSKESTEFRVLAPTVVSVKLLIYDSSLGTARTKYLMEKNSKGVYYKKLKGDYRGRFYTFLVDDESEVTDPYSYAASLNGIRSAIVDLSSTNPVGWESHKIPYRKNLCNSVIYEVHVKDFTVHESSNVEAKGKYLGFVEEGSKCGGLATGIDHLKELGITHVHLMPVYDYLTVEEDPKAFYNDDNYNWGYDPEHYNVPEGSYSLKPQDPGERIKELKTLIMGLHEAGISVVLDVVYNHTYRTDFSNFNVLYPNYYYRTFEDGTFSDGSGCGNELATERTMVKKFIMSSVKYWLEEFKVDGFRFDLMGLMDKDTAQEITTELKEMKEDILIYGEPWTAGVSVLDYSQLTLKGAQYNKGFAFFNDDFRDAIKGSNDDYQIGFVQGNIAAKAGVETGLVGSVDYDARRIGFTATPSETVNYANSHDNLILADKLKLTFPGATHQDLIHYNKFALSIVLMAQGIPFIHAGNEFLRSKNMEANSYNKPISVNAIDWSLKEKNIDLFNYTKDLIHLKKNYKGFNLCDPEEIKEKLKFLDIKPGENLIAYTIEMKKDEKYLMLIFNGNSKESLISDEEIKNHLSKDKISLKKIFGMDGYVSEREETSNLAGITVKDKSSEVWEITI